jgi:hypothetical protein
MEITAKTIAFLASVGSEKFVEEQGCKEKLNYPFYFKISE